MPRIVVAGLASIAFALSLVTVAVAARTDVPTKGLTVCNDTGLPVSVALGFKGEDGWQSEGWQHLAANECAMVRDADLSGQRYYYLYASSDTVPASWQGDTVLCTRHDGNFAIFGTDDCLARGYEPTGYFEVDTRNSSSWTVRLREVFYFPPPVRNVTYRDIVYGDGSTAYQWSDTWVEVDATRELADVLEANGFAADAATEAADTLSHVLGSSAIGSGTSLRILMGTASGGTGTVPYRVSIYETVDGERHHRGTASVTAQAHYILGLAPSDD